MSGNEAHSVFKSYLQIFQFIRMLSSLSEAFSNKNSHLIYKARNFYSNKFVKLIQLAQIFSESDKTTDLWNALKTFS